MRSARLVAGLSAVLLSLACPSGTNPPPPDPNPTPGTESCTVGTSTLELPLPDEPGTLPDFAGQAVDVSCVGAPVAIGAGATATLQGCIDIFGLGGKAKSGIMVAIFGDDQDPKAEAPAYGEAEIFVKLDADGRACGGVDADFEGCRAAACSKEGYYRIANVPTHVPLTMKVYKPADADVIETYTWGVVFDYLETTAVDGVVYYEANLVYKSTYDSIPTLAGRIVDGQQNTADGVGRGVVAGEIRDCQDRVVQGATITTDQYDPSTKITYFDGNTDDPKPALARLSTNTDGLYVVLNATTDAANAEHILSAGMIDPACTGEDCACVLLGTRAIRAYPDSVSIATFRGDFPSDT
jgi:hypothetical protein